MSTEKNESNPPIIDENWLPAFLYYAEPWEKLLTDAVAPFVEGVLNDKLAEAFFFIRYWERGPHIRLRFRGDRKRMDSELVPRLEAYFEKYFADHPSQMPKIPGLDKLPEEHRWFPNNSIQYIPYEPEIERYGGPVGMPIGEREFEASSRAILAVIAESSEWSYDRALGSAIQMHLGMAHAFDFTPAESIEFFRQAKYGWMWSAHQSLTPLEEQKDWGEPMSPEEREKVENAFEEQFEQQKEMLVPYQKMLWEALREEVEFEQEWMNQWVRSMQEIARDLTEAQSRGEIKFPHQPSGQSPIELSRRELFTILLSYYHMTNNRLGVMNRDEGYLGHLLMRGWEDIEKQSL